MNRILTGALVLTTVSTFAQPEQKGLFNSQSVGTKPTAVQLYTQGARFNSPVWLSQANHELTADEKRAGLSLVWSEAKYNFAYFDKVPNLDWDSLYVSYLPRVAQTKTTEDYYFLLREMVAQLQDGHTAVFPPNIEELAKPAFATGLVEGKVLITKLYDEGLSKQGIWPGLEILAVNGEDVHAYARRAVRPYISSSTEQNRLAHQYDGQFLIVKKGTEVVLTVRDQQQQVRTQTVRCTRTFLEANVNARTFTFYQRPDGIAYVSLDYFDHPSIVAKFDSIYPQLKKASGLILDLRRNGGGNSDMGWQILTRLTNQDFPMLKWQTRNYQPAQRAWGNEQSWTGDQWIYRIHKKDTADYFRGPIAVLTSPRTNSAAEDFLAAFIQAKRGILVGEPSAGSTGQPLIQKMPGGGLLIICTKRDMLYDGTEWVGKGFQPTVPVSQTLADFYKGRDTVLERAIRELKD